MTAPSVVDALLLECRTVIDNISDDDASRNLLARIEEVLKVQPEMCNRKECLMSGKHVYGCEQWQPDTAPAEGV